jgi:hypothetical protein
MSSHASEALPFCRKTAMHSLNGAAQALFLLAAIAANRPGGSDADTWAWTCDRIFSKEGAGLVAEEFAKLGYIFSPEVPAVDAQSRITAYLDALRAALEDIRAKERQRTYLTAVKRSR